MILSTDRSECGIRGVKNSLLWDRFDPLDLWNVRLEVPLDPHLERDVGGRATDAGTVESDLHCAICRDADELDIAAIGLDRRPDEVEDLSDTLVDRRGRAGLRLRCGICCGHCDMVRR